MNKMARTTLPPRPADYEAQSQSQSQPQPQTQPSPASTMLVTALVMKLITMACLIVSAILLASNSATIKGAYGSEASIHFNDIYSYRYALAVAVIGLAYTLLQLPFYILQVINLGKLLPNHAKLLVADFFGDKVVLGLVGTGVGAALGSTVDLKRNLDSLDDAIEQYLSSTSFTLLRAKLDDFFNRAYLPAIFLLIAFLTCGISSILSSLALLNKLTQAPH